MQYRGFCRCKYSSSVRMSATLTSQVSHSFNIDDARMHLCLAICGAIRQLDGAPSIYLRGQQQQQQESTANRKAVEMASEEDATAQNNDHMNDNYVFDDNLYFGRYFCLKIKEGLGGLRRGVHQYCARVQLMHNPAWLPARSYG